MGATYTRQSSSNIVDGNVIEASDINNEFNQLLAAFVASSGHTHDGTSAEGGAITKLLGTAITIGDATSGTDIAVTFDGESNDGVLTWMEDEDYFQFSDDLLLSTTEKLQFRDTAIYINSSADGQLDLVADTEIQIAATTIDINGAVALDGAITGATNITLSGELDAATLDISGDADIDGTLETDALSINGTAITSTAAEINILDGDNSASSVTIADADRIILNDGGTMKQVAVTALNTYTSASIAADDIGTGDAAVTIATSSGNITIDAQAGDADIIFKGTDSSSDITALTLDMSEAGAATFNNKIIATELDISGDVDIDGTLETDALTINGTTLSETIADTVGAMVSSNTETGIAVTYEDGDNTLDFALGAAQTTITSLLATDIKIGEDDQTKIDFETADEIHFYAANAEQVYVADGIFGPQTDSDVDLGSSSVRWKDAYIDSVTTTGAVTVGGNLTVNGTTTTVNSTTTTVDDPIMTLGGDSAPGSDDNKDRGLEFRWHNGSAAKLGFFGYDDSASAFTFIPDASNSSEVFSGTVGNAIFGDITGTLQTAAQTNITSLGTLTALTVDNVSVNGATIGHTSDTDLITLADGVVTVAGEVSATTLDIGGTNITATAAELNIMDGVTATASELNIMDGVTATTAELNIMDGVTSTAAELSIMDGDTNATSTTLADADRVVVNDAGTMKQVAMTDVTTYINSNASFASQGFSIAMSVAL